MGLCEAGWQTDISNFFKKSTSIISGEDVKQLLICVLVCACVNCKGWAQNINV